MRAIPAFQSDDIRALQSQDIPALQSHGIPSLHSIRIQKVWQRHDGNAFFGERLTLLVRRNATDWTLVGAALMNAARFICKLRANVFRLTDEFAHLLKDRRLELRKLA